jgi:hypothetical protein
VNWVPFLHRELGAYLRDPCGIGRREEDRAVPRERLRAHAPTVRLGAANGHQSPNPRVIARIGAYLPVTPEVAGASPVARARRTANLRLAVFSQPSASDFVACGDDVTMDKSPSQLIDARIEELGDWRGELLARLRGLVKEADPEVVEEWKWRGVPTWYHDGMICTGETYKSVVKMTFAKGASLEDPSGLFNSSLEGNTRRAIDFHEGEEIDEEALKALIRAAVALNGG